MRENADASGVPVLFAPFHVPGQDQFEPWPAQIRSRIRGSRDW